MKKVLVSGCNGQMGQTICRLIADHPRFEVICGFDKVKEPVRTFPVYDTIEELTASIIQSFDIPDVIIDFSAPAATMAILSFAVAHNVPLVIATTGLDDSTEPTINGASRYIPVFKSANMSFEINLLKKVLQMIASWLPNSDIEITERHHNRKKDSPSGTALLLASSINEALGGSKEIVYGRTGKREPNEIGISSIRGGCVVGEHTIGFYGEFEKLEISHTVYSRDVFAEGAIKAAEFLIRQQPGLYTMDNMI